MNDISKNVLVVENLSYVYDNDLEKINILENLNLKLIEGEMIALVGPSGSGKTTFLNCVGLLDRPSSGMINILNENCNLTSEYLRTKIRSKQIGFIFQSHRLFPEFSSIENVVIPQLLIGIEKKIAYKNAKKILETLGLKDRLFHRPAKLSGGEAQRVAIARALANAPKIVLADEPTGNLDTQSSNLVFELLYKIVKISKLSCVVATHNAELAKKMDKVYLINNKKLELIRSK